MTDELLSAKREKYPVNKGIGRPVEFKKGLKAQYLFLLCRRAARRLHPVCHPVHGWCWPVALHRLRHHGGFRRGVAHVPAECEYGEHGLMKLGAARMRPRYLIHRRRVFHLLRRKKERRKDMRNVMKNHTGESRFPLLAVEHGCIISRTQTSPPPSRWNCRKSIP